MSRSNRSQRQGVSNLDAGRANALFYGCGTIQEAQTRYDNLTAQAQHKNPHAKALLLRAFNNTKLRILQDETARLTLMRQGVQRPTDLASMVAFLNSSDPVVLAAALEQSDMQLQKRKDESTKPMPKDDQPAQAPTPTPAPQPDAVEEVVQEPTQADDDGWEIFPTTPTKDKVKVGESVEMPNAGFVASAAPVEQEPVREPEQPSFTTESVEQQAQDIKYDVDAAVSFPLGAGSRYYPQQWAFFSEDEKQRICISFLNDIGGRSGLDAAVLRRELHATSAAEILTLVARKKTEAGKRGAQTRKERAAK